MSIFVETKTTINVHGVLLDLTKDQVKELYDLLGKELGYTPIIKSTTGFIVGQHDVTKTNSFSEIHLGKPFGGIPYPSEQQIVERGFL